MAAGRPQGSLLLVLIMCRPPHSPGGRVQFVAGSKEQQMANGGVSLPRLAIRHLASAGPLSSAFSLSLSLRTALSVAPGATLSMFHSHVLMSRAPLRPPHPARAVTQMHVQMRAPWFPPERLVLGPGLCHVLQYPGLQQPWGGCSPLRTWTQWDMEHPGEGPSCAATWAPGSPTISLACLPRHGYVHPQGSHASSMCPAANCSGDPKSPELSDHPHSSQVGCRVWAGGLDIWGQDSHFPKSLSVCCF